MIRLNVDERCSSPSQVTIHTKQRELVERLRIKVSHLLWIEKEKKTREKRKIGNFQLFFC